MTLQSYVDNCRLIKARAIIKIMHAKVHVSHDKIDAFEFIAIHNDRHREHVSLHLVPTKFIFGFSTAQNII